MHRDILRRNDRFDSVALKVGQRSSSHPAADNYFAIAQAADEAVVIVILGVMFMIVRMIVHTV